jgi:uncharacterized phage-like protein YoqJ
MESPKVFINRFMGKENVVYILKEYYPAIKKNEILSFVATSWNWRTPSSMKHAWLRKTKHYIFSLRCGSQQVDFIGV